MTIDKVTSNEVAKRAGVSQSAVSRVFTPGASASKRTVEKVRKAAEELGYRPNVLARAMITGKSRIIGLVVAYLDNYFYPLAVEKLSVALQERGYHVLVFMAAPTVDDVQNVVREILDYQVEGIILASVSMSSILARQCDENGIPVILFNRDQDDPRMSSVTTDNYVGGKEIAKHLISCGYSKIGYIAGFEGASTQRDREQGLRDGLAEAGLAPHARKLGNFVFDEARIAALEMFSGKDRPDAVFVCNDHMAFAVMDALRSQLGLSVPHDVAVCGFDDVPIAAWPAYSLTTYRQPLDQMIAATVSAVFERIENKQAQPGRVVLEGELIIRGSSPQMRDSP